MGGEKETRGLIPLGGEENRIFICPKNCPNNYAPPLRASEATSLQLCFHKIIEGGGFPPLWKKMALDKLGPTRLPGNPLAPENFPEGDNFPEVANFGGGVSERLVHSRTRNVSTLEVFFN